MPTFYYLAPKINAISHIIINETLKSYGYTQPRTHHRKARQQGNRQPCTLSDYTKRWLTTRFCAANRHQSIEPVETPQRQAAYRRIAAQPHCGEHGSVEAMAARRHRNALCQTGNPHPYHQRAHLGDSDKTWHTGIRHRCHGRTDVALDDVCKR